MRATESTLARSHRPVRRVVRTVIRKADSAAMTAAAISMWFHGRAVASDRTPGWRVLKTRSDASQNGHSESRQAGFFFTDGTRYRTSRLLAFYLQ